MKMDSAGMPYINAGMSWTEDTTITITFHGTSTGDKESPLTISLYGTADAAPGAASTWGLIATGSANAGDDDTLKLDLGSEGAASAIRILIGNCQSQKDDYYLTGMSWSWGGAVNIEYGTSVTFLQTPVWDQVAPYPVRKRLIASEVNLAYAGSTLNNQGTITVSYHPCGSRGQMIANQILAGDSQYFYDGPFHKGLHLRWRPETTTDLEFSCNLSKFNSKLVFLVVRASLLSFPVPLS